MEVLSHINKRLKGDLLVKLPLQELVNQYTSSQVPSFVKNFTIIYIEMAFPRANIEVFFSFSFSFSFSFFSFLFFSFFIIFIIFVLCLIIKYYKFYFFKKKDRVVCIPKLLTGLASRAPAHQTTIFHLLLPNIEQFSRSKLKDLSFTKNEKDSAILLRFLLDFLLYFPNKVLVFFFFLFFFVFVFSPLRRLKDLFLFLFLFF